MKQFLKGVAVNPNEPVNQPMLSSIQVGMPQTLTDENWPDPDRATWTTGIYKSPVDGWVNVGEVNIDGDGFADLVHHGGIDKAVLAYSGDHYEAWRSEFEDQQVVNGMFGENLTFSGLDETMVCIGDHFQINDVIFEVSQPRQPCWKLARRWNWKELPKRVVQTARCGWYCRVLQTGAIKSDLPIELIHRVNPKWTIKRAHQTCYDKSADQADRQELIALKELSKAFRDELL